MKNSLWKLFTAEEIKCATFDMGPTKAPGPDGFQAIFYQKCWNVVGDETSRIWLQILNGEVVLIKKLANPLSLKEFRPIGLYSFVYKIVTKVLANRMKACLPSIISPNQSAFVPTA
ncbi:hypothetical protein Dsin_021525 [Dipteronia sinensis]|uniref:Reverse transcriptase domain-containing protein n=1 Tax=Dipteronia sinensis TaxID=43782 RepID=A0AAE0A0C3_9ROSI|nr:hypothetical protein Dsin_021525 [Dipteronia sinensis]